MSEQKKKTWKIYLLVPPAGHPSDSAWEFTDDTVDDPVAALREARERTEQDAEMLVPDDEGDEPAAPPWSVAEMVFSRWVESGVAALPDPS